MDKIISTLRGLAKIAFELDKQGKFAEADMIDETLIAIAQDSTLQPIGETWVEQGKTYRKFYNERTGLVTKEVDASGNPIATAVTPTSSTKQPAEPTFWEKYNPFPGLTQALTTDNSAAVTKEQSKSEVPWISKADEPNQFAGDATYDQR